MFIKAEYDVLDVCKSVAAKMGVDYVEFAGMKYGSESKPGLRGNTFNFKDLLKQCGFMFDYNAKVWFVFSSQKEEAFKKLDSLLSA